MGDSADAKHAPEALRKDVEGFDHAKLKECKSKGEEATPSQARDMTMAGEFNVAT